jgi:hypothetical protein
MIRGWFTDIPLWLGRDGIRIPESGLAGRISRLEPGSESVGGVVLDGDGVIGGSTGTITQCCLITADTFPVAQRFITGAISIAVEWGAREVSTGVGQRPGLSTGIGRRPEDMLHREVRVASARALSAATTMVDRPGAFPHAEAPASAAVEGTLAAEGTEVAGGDGNQRSGMLLLDRET